MSQVRPNPPLDWTILRLSRGLQLPPSSLETRGILLSLSQTTLSLLIGTIPEAKVLPMTAGSSMPGPPTVALVLSSPLSMYSASRISFPHSQLVSTSEPVYVLFPLKPFPQSPYPHTHFSTPLFVSDIFVPYHSPNLYHMPVSVLSLLPSRITSS